MALGFICGVLVLWLATPTRATIAAGLAVAVVGEAIRFWAAGHLNKSREVTASGPYRLVAHPLYVGSSIIGAGLAVASGRVAVARDRGGVSGDHADGGHPQRGGVSAADVRRATTTRTARDGRRR